MSIEKVYNIMNQLENESSRTGKEQILKNHEGDTDFREALEFLLNPYIVTGISTKKMNKEVTASKVVKMILLESFKDVINHLKENNSGKDSDIIAVNRFINSLESEELQTFVKRFVTKDLKLGISEKTVNKIYGKDTIPTFAVMLAESYEKKADKVKGKFYITQKLDGNRCIAIVEESGVKFFTRKGQPIEDMVELEEQFSNLQHGVYDGEVLLINKNNLNSADLFRATQKVIRKDGEKKDLEFYIFDAITISEFKNGKSKRNYSMRRNSLDTIVSTYVKDLKNIHILPVLYEGEDVTQILILSAFADEKGWEGLMLNTGDGLYQTKRVVDLLKIKKMKTADLLVVSLEKAIDGQFEGLMSRVSVEYKGNLVGIGSGFTLEDRKNFIENPDDIVGKIIEVSYFEESINEKTQQLSLRFPIYKGIRYDKGVEDIRYE